MLALDSPAGGLLTRYAVALQRWNDLVGAKNRKGAPDVEDRRESRRRRLTKGKTGFTSGKRRFDFFCGKLDMHGTNSGGDGDCARRSGHLNRATEEPPPHVEVFRK
jgi:hypothetical protein